MSATALRVLIVEDRESDVRLAERELRRAGFDPHMTRVETEPDFLAQLVNEPEIILSDFTMPQFDAMRALRALKKTGKEIPFVILSGTIGEDIAVEAMQEGAADYVLKDRMSRLGTAVQRALERKTLMDSGRHAQAQLQLQAAALDAAADGIFITGSNGNIVWVNDALCQMTGYAAEELIGRNPRILKSGEHDAAFYRDLWKTILSGKVWQGEIINQRKDLSLYVEQMTVTPVRGGSGEITHFVAIKQDITAAKESQEKLAERARLADLVSDISLALVGGGDLGGMLHQCAEALVKYLHVAFARIWTVPPRAESGLPQIGSESGLLQNGAKNAPGSVSPALPKLVLQASVGKYFESQKNHLEPPSGRLEIELVVRKRKPCLTNDVLSDPNLSNLDWAKIHGITAFAGYPLLMEDRLLGVIALFSRQPLTEATMQGMASVANHIALGIERVNSQQSLAKTNRYLETLIDAAPLAIIALDGKGSVTSWNAASEAMLGWKADEVLGKPPPVVPPNKQEEYVQLFANDRAGKNTTGLETQRQKQDGALINVSVSTAPLYTKNGNFDGAIRLLQDISEQKRLEAQFRQAQKMEAVGLLAGGVAHDFNNLLTIISGYSEIMLSALAPDDQQRESVKAIFEAGERAATLTRQLLAFSRKTIIEPRVLELNNIVKETENMLGRMIGEDIVLTTVGDPHLQRIKVDPGQLGQILMNLAVNARDAMPQGGRLTIATRNVELDEAFCRRNAGAFPGKYVELAISDTGCGMTPEVQARIFEPFFTTKGIDKGTGLGLAVVYGIMKQSNGYIDVVSAPGQGATFKLYFPASKERPSSHDILASDVTTGSETVLLVEDESGVRRIAKLALETHGYKVLAAKNGEEAFQVVEKYEDIIDLIVTDVVMPGLGGREIAEAMAERFPNIRTLYISGYTDNAAIRQGLVQENVAFLHKPFTPRDLARKVRSVLDEKR